MNGLLEKRDSIYGACAIWIILFHTFRRISMPYIPVLTNIVSIGNMAVDIFFFFSGLCLSLSAAKHDYPNTGWSAYFRRRLTRVLLPYLIVGIPYFLWSAVYEASGGIRDRSVWFLKNLSSVKFWMEGTQTVWFVYGILVFYVLFPVIYTFVNRNGAGKIIALMLGMILFAIVAYYSPILKNGTIVWARLPVFTAGIIAGKMPDKDRAPGKAQMAAAAAITVFLGWLTSLSELSRSFTIPPVYRFLLFLPLSLALLTLLSGFGKKVRFLERIGGLSLELYLVHVTLLHPLKYYGLLRVLGNKLYFLLPLVSLLLAWAVGTIEKLILKRKATA